MSKYERWRYILHDVKKHDTIQDGELFYDYANDLLYLRNSIAYDIQMTDSNIFNHIKNFNNPHNVSKEQLGLDKIPNVPLISIEDYDNHIKDPTAHSVTKEQINLGNIFNYSISTDDDVKNESKEVYLSAKHAKMIIDNALSEYLDANKIKIYVTCNVDKYKFSLRKRGTSIWTSGNFQIVEIGEYEYKIEADGYYSKSAMISLNKDKSFDFTLDKIGDELFIRRTLDGDVGVGFAIDNINTAHIWGEDLYEGITESSSIKTDDVHQIFIYNDVYIVLYLDGTISHWGSGASKYPFLRLVPTNKKFKSFTMNDKACVLLDEDGAIYSYGDADLISKQPKTAKLSNIYCNRSLFIGIIKETKELVAWGEDFNNMISHIPQGKFKHIAISNNDIVGIDEDNYCIKWGNDDLIKSVDIPISKVAMVDIKGSSLVSIIGDGTIVMYGKIKDTMNTNTMSGKFINCKLVDANSLITISDDKSLGVYPRSTSLLYTSKPTQKTF